MRICEGRITRFFDRTGGVRVKTPERKYTTKRPSVEAMKKIGPWCCCVEPCDCRKKWLELQHSPTLPEKTK